MSESVIELIENKDKTVSLILDNSSTEIKYDLKNGIYNILVFNNTEHLDLIESGSIENAEVNLTFIELSSSDLKHRCNIDLLKNSTLNINTVYLGVSDKVINYSLNNLEYNSNSYITNRVVCLDGSAFNMEITGNILKGAKNSKAHQKSNCLTIDNPKMAKVLPVLNIDENDVEASHSLSCGTVDEEVMFYMNIRGLSQSDALHLLLKSYLLPDDMVYEPFENGDEIKKLTVGKVETLCLI